MNEEGGYEHRFGCNQTWKTPVLQNVLWPAWTIKLGSKRFSLVLGEQHALVSGGLMHWTGWVYGALVQAQLPAKTGALGPWGHLTWAYSLEMETI